MEITGPVERKMVINALNANVKVFMADFEDSLAPNWDKVIEGQVNLRDAVNGTISFTNEAGKIYQLKPNPAVLIARVRGLSMSLGKVSLSPAACLILPCTSSTTTKLCWRREAAPISICRKRSLTMRQHGGVRSSALPKIVSICRVERSKPPC